MVRRPLNVPEGLAGSIGESYFHSNADVLAFSLSTVSTDDGVQQVQATRPQPRLTWNVQV